MSGGAAWSGMGRAGSGGVRSRTSGPVVVAVMALDSVVLGMFAPLSLLYLVAVSGQSLARVGVVLTVAGVLAGLLPPAVQWWGWWGGGSATAKLRTVSEVGAGTRAPWWWATATMVLTFDGALIRRRHGTYLGSSAQADGAANPSSPTTR